MMTSLSTRQVLASLLCLLIASCGWHLRGQGDNSAALSNVALTGNQGEVYQVARKMLERQDALVTANSAETILELGKERLKRRTVSVSGSALAAEFQLTLELPYKITDANNQVIASDQLSIIRSYRYDQNDVAGKSREETLLKEEMTKSLARRLLNLTSYLRKPAQ